MSYTRPLEFEAKLAASALASATWYASEQRQGKAIDNLQKASLYGFAIKDPEVGQRLRELCRATYKAWEALDFNPTGFYWDK